MELILEVGPCDGDIQYAFDVIHAAKESGADWVKGQIYDRDRLVTQAAATYAQPGIQVPNTQYEDFGKQLSYDEWAQVKQEADRIGMRMFWSVFDFPAVDFCETVNAERYKLASGDITYQQLIRRVTATGKHVILSTGASSYREIHRAVQWVAQHHTNLSVLACTLSYPTQLADTNLLRMDSIKPIWNRVGYSDHTFGVGAIIRAHHLGAVMVEKHFTIRPGEGGDHDFAVTPEQLSNLDLSERGSNVYDGSPELGPSTVELKARTGARRSIWATRDLVRGSILNREDTVVLRPGGGLEPWQLDEYVGRPLRFDVPAMTALREDMF